MKTKDKTLSDAANLMQNAPVVGNARSGMSALMVDHLSQNAQYFDYEFINDTGESYSQIIPMIKQINCDIVKKSIRNVLTKTIPNGRLKE